MRVLTVHGEINSPEVVNADFHTPGSLAVMAHRLEMEGAKILFRDSSSFRFRGGLGAKSIASKWNFLLKISSGEVQVFTKDKRVFTSYKIRFGEWALIVLAQFIVIGSIMMYSFTQDATGTAFLSNIYCLTALLLLSFCYFGVSAALATGKFRELLHACLIESNQAMPDYTS